MDACKKHILAASARPETNPMVLCNVYRSDRKAETYLYLAHDRAFDDLPSGLRQAFGEPAFVMQLQLSDERRLARVEVGRVLEQVAKQGFYLQLPPELAVEHEISRRFS
jgi:uncharacterized protein YcgL (UPF0745 family)